MDWAIGSMPAMSPTAAKFCNAAIGRDLPGAAICDGNQKGNISIVGGHLADMRKLFPQDLPQERSIRRT
jgi:hypothetical protein